MASPGTGALPSGWLGNNFVCWQPYGITPWTNGNLVFSALPPNAANDAAASAAGVPVGGVYRNGGPLLVRTV